MIIFSLIFHDYVENLFSKMNGGFNSLEEAVLCFYDSNNVHRSEAQKWLSELQNSPRIWSAIWDELLPSKVSTI